ncbi:hypothetical protein JW766_04625 [Candidatus Dojkabacteria bacterium]|nr:hypothetical protein [Candidatus Dojkabacteria bacterium]
MRDIGIKIFTTFLFISLGLILVMGEVYSQVGCVREGCSISINLNIAFVGLRDEDMENFKNEIESIWGEAVSGRFECDVDFVVSYESSEKCPLLANENSYCIELSKNLIKDENGKEYVVYVNRSDGRNPSVRVWGGAYTRLGRVNGLEEQGYKGYIAYSVGRMMGLETDYDIKNGHYNETVMGYSEGVDKKPSQEQIDQIVDASCNGDNGTCPSTCACGRNALIDTDIDPSEECDLSADPVGCEEGFECDDKCKCVSIEEIISVDDINPEATSIDTSSWGQQSGINAQENIPALDRLSSGYVIRGRTFEIRGRAEQYSKIEVYVDSYKVGETSVSSEGCSGSTKAYGSTYYQICDWNYNLTIGAVETSYNIRTKVVDRAGNKSQVSTDTVVNYDKTPPHIPYIKSAGDYWNEDGLGNITNLSNIKLLSEIEKNSDFEVWFKDPLGSTDYTLFQNYAGINWSQDKAVLSDGWYEVQMKSTDAAGNGSQLSILRLERDTVAPNNPEAGKPYKCNENSICIDISGEDNSKVYVNDVYIGKASSSGGTFKVLEGYERRTRYYFSIFLEDRARNRSGTVFRNIRIK